MKILVVLTYYRPHISGLTIYAERLARGLAQQGHRVTVLTSHYSKELPWREIIDGVTVVRHPVLFRLSKGVIMPAFFLHAAWLVMQQDVVSIHLPQAEGGGLAILGRLFGKPTVLTFQCDLQLPKGMFNPFIEGMVLVANNIAGIFANKIVAISADYARHSPFLLRFKDKTTTIYPPVEMSVPDAGMVAEIKQRYASRDHAIVGFAARFAAEKGIDYLIQSIPYVAERIPKVRYLLVGENQAIGENVWERLQPLLQKYREYIQILGTLPDEKMSAFFGACDVLTVPSINSTESFGLVQIEAMFSGCPVVASNLPGVREPVRMTGMGEIVPIKDARALADAIVRVLQNRDTYIRPRKEIEEMFALEGTVKAYELLFESLKERTL